jgi:hypothetical protein
MKTEKKDLSKFEAMTESIQGTLIGGFSTSVSVNTGMDANDLKRADNYGCNNCKCLSQEELPPL